MDIIVLLTRFVQTSVQLFPQDVFILADFQQVPARSVHQLQGKQPPKQQKSESCPESQSAAPSERGAPQIHIS